MITKNSEFSYMGRSTSAEFALPKDNQSWLNWIINRGKTDLGIVADASLDGVKRVYNAIRNKTPIATREELAQVPNNLKQLGQVRNQQLDALDSVGEATGWVQKNSKLPEITNPPSTLPWVENRRVPALPSAPSANAPKVPQQSYMVLPSNPLLELPPAPARPIRVEVRDVTPPTAALPASNRYTVPDPWVGNVAPVRATVRPSTVSISKEPLFLPPAKTISQPPVAKQVPDPVQTQKSSKGSMTNRTATPVTSTAPIPKTASASNAPQQGGQARKRSLLNPWTVGAGTLAVGTPTAMYLNNRYNNEN